MESPGGATRSLKRSHDDMFEDLADLEEPCSLPADFMESIESEKDSTSGRLEDSRDRMGEEIKIKGAEESLPTPPVHSEDRKERERSMTDDLTDAGSTTPSLRGDSPGVGGGPADSGMNASSVPSAFAVLNGSAPPPPKKAKLTFQEKEMKRINKEIRDQERAAEKARKDAEKQAHAEEKARKDAEKEVERKKKEAEKEAERKKKEAEKEAERKKKEAEKEAERKKKEAEKEEKRAALEAEKAAKEEKRRKKEEEKQRVEDEKRKKERSQMKLGNFFNIPAKDRGRASSVGSKERSSMSPAPPNSIPNAFASPVASTSNKPETTPYEKMFPAFFIQNNVTIAPTTRFERDEEARRNIQNTIDSYISGNRSPGRQRGYDAQSLFHLSDTSVRGKRCMPVREIMDEMSGNSSRPIDLTTDSQNSQIKRTTDLLRRVPLKFLHFQEDVRPPYRGTYTSRPVNGIAKLARNPLRKDLPNTDYDYDSEAEWVEDEDAEDLKSEADDEEEVDEDEDLDGFLDDENDETANSRRMVLQGDLEPVSTGLCWEDRRRRNSNVKMMPYRMEVILDPTIKSIDPFSSSYWEPASKQKSMDPPRLPLNSMKPPNTTLSNNKSVKPFFTPASELSSQPSTSQQPSFFLPPPSSISSPGKSKPGLKPKKLISEQDMPAFKAAIEGSDLSKVGLIEVLKKKFPGRSGAAIKGTLEVVARRVGQKEVDKRWVVFSGSGT